MSAALTAPQPLGKRVAASDPEPARAPRRRATSHLRPALHFYCAEIFDNEDAGTVLGASILRASGAGFESLIDRLIG